MAQHHRENGGEVWSRGGSRSPGMRQGSEFRSWQRLRLCAVTLLPVPDAKLAVGAGRRRVAAARDKQASKLAMANQESVRI